MSLFDTHNIEDRGARQRAKERRKPSPMNVTSTQVQGAVNRSTMPARRAMILREAVQDAPACELVVSCTIASKRSTAGVSRAHPEALAIASGHLRIQ